MALAPGDGRKDLSADSLFRVLRAQFGSLPDPRAAAVEIPLGDALMSAFAMFALKGVSKTRPQPPGMGEMLNVCPDSPSTTSITCSTR